MSNRICYYYQTFNGLDKLIENPSVVDTIIVSSIHFGNNKDGTPYIHMNDLEPSNKAFDIVWNQTKLLSDKYNKEILLMMGGAGGAYGELFKNYDVYYPMLVNTIKTHNWIKGVDLDIEEPVSISGVQKLIRDIHSDFGDSFTITMAPLASSLMSDQGGMGGFIYKDLFTSEEGKFITRFNVQAYGSYNYETFESMVNNGYPADKLVLGMLSGQFNKDAFATALIEIRKIVNIYGNIGGVFDWEYFDAPPNPNDPSEWAKYMSEIIKPETNILKKAYNYLKSIFFN